jgi:hypothetical protein
MKVVVAITKYLRLEIAVYTESITNWLRHVIRQLI